MSNRYETPLTNRYASDYMCELFSADTKYSVWRKLWVSLAKAEMRLGLPISIEQISELEKHICDIDYTRVKEIENETHHDVMAHIRAYGEICPNAAPIIHLGATSCYVTDNCDLIIYKKALEYIEEKLIEEIKILSNFANKYKSIPTLGYTHYQPAQLVTVGKRATLWIQDLYLALQSLRYVIGDMKFLGCRGTTGTEASFLNLFDGDTKKIDEMNKMIASEFDFDKCFNVSGQTYPRIYDSIIINSLSLIAQASYRMANDIRLLQHDKQIEEPFGKNQVGSSAMAYKRNPMMCERICSLSRYVICESINPQLTSIVQWFERTLDDSANRRMSLPEAFLTTDAILLLMQKVSNGLVVNEKIIEKEVMKYLPFIATENIMMEAVKKGGNRQDIHEEIRKLSVECMKKLKNGEDFDLIKDISESKIINIDENSIKKILLPSNYIGRCVEQVDNYLDLLRETL